MNEINEFDSLQQEKMRPEEELLKMARENRRFTILQRERTIDNLKKSKNRSAMIAATLVLSELAIALVSEQSNYQLWLNKIHLSNSWMNNLVLDVGPLLALISISAGVFMANYFRNSKKLKQAQEEFIDFNASLENTQDLGGNDNAKSR